MYYLLVNFSSSATVLVVRRGRASEGLTLLRGTNKAFPRSSHCPDAPPSVGVIVTGGTKTARRIPGVFKR